MFYFVYFQLCLQKPFASHSTSPASLKITFAAFLVLLQYSLGRQIVDVGGKLYESS